MKKTAAMLTLLLAAQSPVWAQTQTTYDKEQVKREYRAFLQQLKALNAQYKEITGEIGQVVKEEGVPTWDMGDMGGIAEVKKDSKESTRDLGGGASLKETDRNMVLTVDLPGYKKDSIKLSFKDGKTLLIAAQRKLEAISRSFERSFDLPFPGNQKESTATYEDGVLTVTVPKVASQETAIPVR